MGLVLALIAAAIVLGVVGVIVDGLFYLLIIGIIALALALIYGAVRTWRGGGRRRTHR